MNTLKKILHVTLYVFLVGSLLVIPATTFIENVRSANQDPRYVTTTGNDGNGCTNSTTDACATLARAIDSRSGSTDTIQISAGTYSSHTDKKDFWIQGTSSNVVGGFDLASEDRFTIRGIGNVTISGESITNFGTDSDPDALMRIDYGRVLQIENITFDGANSSDATESQGILITETSDDIVFENLEVTNTFNQCFEINAGDIDILDSEIHNCSRNNFNGTGNDSALTPAIDITDQASSVNIEESFIHSNWGEGIKATVTEDLTIEQNALKDNYRANIMIDNSKEIELERNYIFNENSTFSQYDSDNQPIGILLTNSTLNSSFYINNIKIANNIIGFGVKESIKYEDDFGGYNNVNILYNTIYGQEEEAILLEDDGETTTGNSMQNNLLVDSGVDAIISIGSTDRSSWIFESNGWIGETPPAWAQDADDVNTSDALFDGDVADNDPGTGVINSPNTVSRPFYPVPEAEHLYLTGASPLILAGTPITEGTEDYNFEDRDPLETTLGALEYTGDVTNPDPDPPTPPPTVPQTDTMYRFYNVGSGSHFYTISPVERNSILSSLPQFIYEGPVYQVLEFGYGGVPVYRFYNPGTAAHFYTRSEVEKNSVLANLPQFIFEGIAFYVYTSPGANRAPVYRFYNVNSGAHLYTNSTVERNSVQANLPQYIYEGIAYYIPNY